MPDIDRRSLLVGGGALAGLVVAYELWPRAKHSPLRAARKGERVFGPYLKVAADGRVTVAVPQAEVGQGSWTALAQVAADELGAEWAMVGVEPAPVAPGRYDNRFFGTRLTAGSTSVRAFDRPLRDAAAVARALLFEAAARRWSLDPADCDAVGGKVVAGGRSLGFGELVEEAAALGRPVRRPERRAIGHGGIAGQPLPRVDGAAKASGGWRFAGDVRLPDMVFASVRLAPPGGRLAGYDKGVPGLVADREWLAASGPTWWAAEQALRRADPRFTGPVDADSPAIDAALAKALASARTVHEVGDYAAATAGRTPLAATYAIAPAPHLALETPAAVARFGGGGLELWSGCLAPDLARGAATEAGGIEAARVTLYPAPSGDLGGGALDERAVRLAVELARRLKRPVSLIFSANSAQTHDRPRPPLLAKIAALGDEGNGIASWHATLAGAPGLDAALARIEGKASPAFDPRGAVPPYAIPALRIDAATAKLPIAEGYLVGDVEALTSFASESFIDELARARGSDPLAFRINLLGQQPRLAACLTMAADKGGWDGGAKGSTMGLACASGFDSHVALLADAAMGADGRPIVRRLVAAVDCGRMVNPALVRQAVETGLLHALVNATGPAPEVIAGVIRARPLAALGLGRLGDAPRVEVHLIGHADLPPGGVSGLGALVLPAALGNALYAATGRRLRRLPFDPNSGA
ncbi:molybdopterin cofactor-binding domain-containing protein [Sphingomonas sp. ASV193]|uniref:molybdopterin cofactor-binding domain-containing protein n=1 Tax=Sphingomonas sp. ASV193 TaxID=3144405 RepID=UPI0032E8F553